MGVMIKLDIVPEKIDAAEWESVYEETLILLNEYSFMDKIVDKEKYNYKWIYTQQSKERELVSGRLGWYTFGDMIRMKNAENFMLIRDLSYYEDFTKEANCDEVLISLINWQSQMTEEIQSLTVNTRSVFNSKTQGYPYHMYILAIACLIESRFPKYACVSGDVTKAQMQKAIEWANSILEKPIEISERANNEKLLQRLTAYLTDQYSQLSAFLYLTINQKNKELGDFITNHFSQAAIKRYYSEWSKRYKVTQVGFSNSLEEYLKLGFDLEMLCNICILDEDSCNYDPTAFIKKVLKFVDKNERTTQDGIDVGINSPDSAAPETVPSLFGKIFLQMSGLSSHVEIDTTVEELKEVFKRKLGHLCDVEEIFEEVLSVDAEAEAEINNQILELLAERGEEQSKKQEYDIEEVEELILWEPGQTIWPEIEEFLEKIKETIEEIVAESEVDFADYSKSEKMRLLMEYNKYFYLSKNTWDFIEASLDNEYIYSRVLALLRIKADNKTTNRACKSILNNLDLFNYLWE
ncbi:hypothetical protein [Fuchsiella alkaliacetigena]|uniref:hypothetical protein n=1 Tax=Fuchsiella alkaliacetigena TaxID=957042 RepID=UPI00200B66EA|nr:hypothetical protein [Fuchsiella alkaliacetigena]MCK8824104.1 hypothetical protein [Fuchsiella alkaliacetigena]